MSFKQYIWERFKKSNPIKKIYEWIKDFLFISFITFIFCSLLFGIPMLIAFILGVLGLSSNWESMWQLIVIIEIGMISIFGILHSIKEKIKDMKREWEWENEE